MKSGSKTIYVLYILIILIIIAVVLLAKTTINNLPKKTLDNEQGIEPLEVDTFPNVNEECTFKVTYLEYGSLKEAGCTGGYTRYDITDVTLGEENVQLSVVYSDKKQPKTGVYVGDKKVLSEVFDLTNIKFGVFDDKLFIYDKKEPNVISINSKLKTVYSLKDYLNSHKVKDLSTGDTNVKTKHLDKESFTFTDGSFEFDAITGKCNNNSSKGSHYIVKYASDKFEKPEFIKLIECEKSA